MRSLKKCCRIDIGAIHVNVSLETENGSPQKDAKTKIGVPEILIATVMKDDESRNAIICIEWKWRKRPVQEKTMQWYVDEELARKDVSMTVHGTIRHVEYIQFYR